VLAVLVIESHSHDSFQHLAWYLHRGISYPVIVLFTRKLGSPEGRVHIVTVGLTFSSWRRPRPLRNSPRSFVTSSSVCWLWYRFPAHVWRCCRRDQPTSLNEGRGRKRERDGEGQTAVVNGCDRKHRIVTLVTRGGVMSLTLVSSFFYKDLECPSFEHL